jgi:hypothetical protein
MFLLYASLYTINKNTLIFRVYTYKQHSKYFHLSYNLRSTRKYLTPAAEMLFGRRRGPYWRGRGPYWRGRGPYWRGRGPY